MDAFLFCARLYDYVDARLIILRHYIYIRSRLSCHALAVGTKVISSRRESVELCDLM